MSYEPQQPRPDYRSGGAGGYDNYDTHRRTGSSGPQNDEKTVAILTHLSGPIAAIISVGWLGFLGPLIVWFIYKDKSPFLRAASAGAFNFNVTLWIINVIGWICIFTVILFPVGLVLIAAYWVLLLVCHIVAAVRANNGEVYRYPMQLPILR
ncbi:DUF4870 domain-containing protein [Kocuria carniphila]|uniref:DUF4870 domain-containing protein n=1 Tax=Kocuria carniphila TaxID=262208 RepID=UPI0034DB60A4